MPRGKPNPKTIAMPDNWKSDFRSHTMRTNFCLALTQPMIELLSAVADDVEWDRSLFHSIHLPDNLFASAKALEKRGLIVRKQGREVRTTHDILSMPSRLLSEYSHYKLTPAGKAVSQLFKITGIFAEADAAIRKKARRG